MLSFCTANCIDLRVGFGIEALKQDTMIPNVIDMLLPNQNADSQQAASFASSNRSQLPASLLGPAFVLRVMAENGKKLVVALVLSLE